METVPILLNLVDCIPQWSNHRVQGEIEITSEVGSFYGSMCWPSTVQPHNSILRLEPVPCCRHTLRVTIDDLGNLEATNWSSGLMEGEVSSFREYPKDDVFDASMSFQVFLVVSSFVIDFRRPKTHVIHTNKVPWMPNMGHLRVVSHKVNYANIYHQHPFNLAC